MRTEGGSTRCSLLWPRALGGSLGWADRRSLLWLSGQPLLLRPQAFRIHRAVWWQDMSSSAPRLKTLQRHLAWPQIGAMAHESSPLTTHVLDTASGLPAQGLCLCLSRRLQDIAPQWMELRKSHTDLDGRCPGLLAPGQMKPGIYKLSFDTERYWKERGQESFYPYVEVVFTIAKETQKFHVPLLLSPWSYTTYRGS